MIFVIGKNARKKVSHIVFAEYFYRGRMFSWIRPNVIFVLPHSSASRARRRLAPLHGQHDVGSSRSAFRRLLVRDIRELSYVDGHGWSCANGIR
jgi:hypothetical protein